MSAKTFMDFVQTMDRLQRFGLDVMTLLDNAVHKTVDVQGCLVTKLKESNTGGGTPRIKVPAVIMEKIRSVPVLFRDTVGSPFDWEPIGQRPQVPITWMVCYVAGKHPQTNQQGWEKAHCRHTCRNRKCIEERHLTWRQ